MASTVRMCGKSHIGKRQLNEDCFFADADKGIALVADGMGGHAAGEIASDIVVTTAVALLQEHGSVAGALEGAHEEVVRAASDGRGKEGMGATGVLAVFDDHAYEIAWVGDSRAYLWNGELWQLTRDHSFVEGQLAKGLITLEQAQFGSNRNLITRALGIADPAKQEVPVITGSLGRGEQLLLCSDGLNDAISGSEIARILSEYDDPEEQVDELVTAALLAGGKDNITVVLASAADDAPAAGSDRPGNPVSVAGADGSLEYFPPEPETPPPAPDTAADSAPAADSWAAAIEAGGDSPVQLPPPSTSGRRWVGVAAAVTGIIAVGALLMWWRAF